MAKGNQKDKWKDRQHNGQKKKDQHRSINL